MPSITYRLATPDDELHVITAFSAMLRELEPLGHDVLPTEGNVTLYWHRVFEPALHRNQHGIVLAFSGETCVGAILITPYTGVAETLPHTAIAYGEYVHPGYRRQGIGLHLQELSFERLRELGYVRVTSTIVADNVAGLHSHKKAGARVTGVVTTVDL